MKISLSLLNKRKDKIQSFISKPITVPHSYSIQCFGVMAISVKFISILFVHGFWVHRKFGFQKCLSSIWKCLLSFHVSVAYYYISGYLFTKVKGQPRCPFHLLSTASLLFPPTVLCFFISSKSLEAFSCTCRSGLLHYLGFLSVLGNA